MHTNIQYLISRITDREIPKPVLDYVFLPNSQFNVLSPTIDWCIRDVIIDNWLLRDCNLAGGQEVVIDLSRARSRDMNGGIIVDIPRSETAGRLITSVLSVVYSMGAYHTSNGANEVSDAAAGPTQVGHSRIRIVGPNSIYIEGALVANTRFLRCVVENEANFANIHPRSLLVLADMAVLAAKAHCYIKGRVKIEQAAIISGVPYGVISDIVEEYRDANEMYLELLKKDWVKVSLLNDAETKKRHIKWLIPK